MGEKREISDACRLYGFDKLECTTRDRVKGDDANSIASVDSGKDDVPLQDRVNSQLFITREMDDGQALWKCSMNESDILADHIAAANQLSHRLPCHSFRSMLPPLLGERPPMRSVSWLRCCTRGVILSYLENEETSPTDRLRFPEHAYCWFDSDDDRWAFFYAMKSYSDSDPECWLAYTLLDDMQGEDCVAFLARAIKLMKKQLGPSWGTQYGEAFCSRENLESNSHLQDAIQQNGCCLEEEQACAANLWVPVDTCNELIDELFAGVQEPDTIRELSSDVNGIAVDIEEEGEKEPSVDLFAFVQIIMQAYIARKKKQMALIRLMFDTASSGVLTDFYTDAQEERTSDHKSLVRVPQLRRIVKTVWPESSLKDTALIFREAYDALYPPSQWNKPAPDGINFQSFLIAAERLALFTKMNVQGSALT